MFESWNNKRRKVEASVFRVLIVDDESVERKGIQNLLKQRKYELEIHLASDGEDAWHMIEAGLRPQILITDIRMPFMDGLSLIKHVREKKLDTRVVIYSAYDEFDYARQALQMGVTDYLLKPVDPQELYSLIEKILTDIQNQLHQQTKPAEIIREAENNSQPYLYRKVLRLVEEHYCEDLGVEGIAQMLGHSASYVSRVFCEESGGETLSKYITHYRMSKAAELLRTTHIRVSKISAMVGYTTPTYFGHVFLKTYQMTPNTYRERYGQ